MLLALGAALSGLAVMSVARTAGYLAIARPVAMGAQITAQDVTTVELRLGSGLSAIASRDLDEVVGRRAAVALLPGTLLAREALTDKEIIGPGQAQIGLGIRHENMPALTLRPGDQVLIVAIDDNRTATDTTPPRQFPATVIDAVASSGKLDDTVLVHLAVAVEIAPTIVALDDVVLVLRPRD